MKQKTAIRLVKEVNEVYESIAEEFDRSRQHLWADFEFFTSHLKSEMEILDVGCGNGRLLDYLKEHSWKSYLGIDASKKLIERAKKQHKGKSIEFKTDDLLKLNLRGKKFDSVFAIALLHHIPSRELQIQALENLLKALKPDGCLYLSVWNLYQVRYIKRFAQGIFRSAMTCGDFQWNDLMIPWGKGTNVQKHFRFCHAFRHGELLKLFKAAGFEVISTKTSSHGNHLVVARPFLGAKEVEILGVKINGVTLEESLETVHRFLNSPNQHIVVTPNPEIILHAQKSESYRKILNDADLKIPDGIGLLWAARFVLEKHSTTEKFLSGGMGLLRMFLYPKSIKGPLPARVTGVDLIQELASKSKLWGAKIFLLGAGKGVAEQVAQKWRVAKIVGTHAGSPAQNKAKEIIDRVNRSGANMLFVAYGAPKQEQWIAENIKKMPHIKVAIGVGGAFDFIAGTKSRAPEWMTKMGLEWLWRLIQEPKRIRRILNAAVVFPFRAMTNRKQG